MQNLMPQAHLPELASLPQTGLHRRGRLWLRWVAANTLGELFGLGLAAAVGVAVMLRWGEPTGTAAMLVIAALMILLGVSEGLIVGYAQWHVLREMLTTLTAKAWLGATALGAFIAWVLGMLPSTIIHLSATGASGAPPTMSDALMFGLAAAMGSVFGIILAWPQWRVLRRHAPRAIWWLPANALAWAAGMPIIFLGAGAISASGLSVTGLGFVVLTLAGAGAIVGAVHGLALLYLLFSQGGNHAQSTSTR